MVFLNIKFRIYKDSIKQLKNMLFNDIVFGPLKSRRLGVSLGINLLPLDSKLCNYDCIYCECGWTDLKSIHKVNFPNREEVRKALGESLIRLKAENTIPDSITFAGNGEPTMHPEFEEIIADTILLRNTYFPQSKISVLSNAMMLNNKKVVEALKNIDSRILKLDSGTEEMYQLINKPIAKRTLRWIVDHLIDFKGKLTIQSLFLKGEYNGKKIDNTTDKEVNEWLKLLKEINPEMVMLYSIDRVTPAEALEKIPQEELFRIAEKVNQLGIPTQVN